MDVTIVICTLKSNERIKALCDYLKPKYEIVVVSPSPIDLAGITILRDAGKGLAAARNVALDNIKSDYVLFLGSDNDIDIADIDLCYAYMLDEGWIICAFLTRYYSVKGYKNRMINKRWRTRFTEGSRSVVGTPCIMAAQYSYGKMGKVHDIRFNEAMPFSDDSDLCERLTDIDYRVGYSDQYCIDHETDIKARFVMYGKGDKQYERAYHKNPLRSLLHIIKCEWLWSIEYIPFYVYIVYYRLKGYFKG